MKQTLEYPIAFLKQYQISEPLLIERKLFEILYILKGHIVVTHPNGFVKQYFANSVFVIHSGRPYVLKSGSDNTILHMGLHAEFVETYIGSDSNIICDSMLEPNRNYLTLKKLLANIAALYFDHSKSHKLSVYGLVFQLLDCFLNDYSLIMPSEISGSGKKYHERIVEIQSYISQNYNKDITLSNLAEHLYLSPQYLSKFFKAHFHENFNEYVNRSRIRHALRDISYTDDAITDIAIRHGFPNIATFNKHFRALHGVSPREYRKESKRDHHFEYDLIFDDNPDPAGVITNDSAYLRDVIVNTGNLTSLTKNYTTLINVGFAKNLFSDAYRIQLLEARKDLHFRYIRLEGLVSNALIPRLVENNNYYFSQVGYILDFLFENRMIPFIELGKNSYDYFKAEKTNRVFRGYSTNKKFTAMLLEFLRYVVGRYPASWYNEWYFELWKAPVEDMSVYISGFGAMQSTLKKYMPEAKFGGPGYNTVRHSDAFLECLKSFHDAGLTPDFISAHFYAVQYKNEDNISNVQVAPHTKFLPGQQKWMRRQIKDILGAHIPLYITEFNSSIVTNTHINQSCFQAAFVCHNILNMHEYSDMIGYWMFSDLSFRLAQPASYLIGGISLISKTGIKLPSYYAYCLLNRLGNELIEKGENYCITKSGINHFQIIAYNYAHFQAYAALKGAENQSLKDVYTLFEETTPINMQFHLTDVVPGIYQVRRYVIDRYHGSSLDINLGGLIAGTLDEERYYQRIHSPAPEVISYIKQACVPEERTIYLEIEDRISVNTILPAHGICLWDIVREY